MSMSEQSVEDFDDEDDGIETMYLTFPIAEETYGVPIARVTEIVGMQQVVSIPDVPPYIKGVINLRGKVIPLMDVRLRFGMAERDYDERTVVIVLQIEKSPVGLIVDGVSEVVDIPDDKIGSTDVYRNGSASNVVSGMGHVGDRIAILLDVSVLMSDLDIVSPEALEA